MPHNTLLYRMAVDSKLVKKGEPFLPENLDWLLGMELQFNVTIAMKGDYLNETIKYMGPLGRNSNSVKLDKKYLFMTQFDGENTDEALGMLTSSAINTMKASPDWVDSKIAVQWAKFKGEAPPTTTPEPQAEETSIPEKKVQTAASPSKGRNEPDFDSFDDDIPF
jgi:hypothetical protein